MKKPLLATTALVSISLFALAGAFMPTSAFANPKGGQVVGGSATISESGEKLDVYQHSHRAVIDWRSFNIEMDEHTQFHQPSSAATALNRINDINPSRIAGQLSANGNIILVNPNGVFFEGSARVDVNGIVATTASIKARDFMSGSNRFDITGNPSAAIVNEGHITAKEAGLVGFVAPHVINSGIIEAKLGKVHLASADTVEIDFYGDGLLHVEVQDEAITSQLVANNGILNAEGGTVAMMAAAARHTLDSLIIADGALAANSIGKDKSGAIVIGAAGSNKTDKEGNSHVIVAGHLDASGREDGEHGGAIEVLGDHIAVLDDAIIDASGHRAVDADAPPEDGGSATMKADKSDDNGVRTEEDFLAQGSRAGGSIKIGGDYLGKGDTQTAKTVYVAENAYILNDAAHHGDGGRTIIWSDNTTDFYGNVFARGGINGGHGGFLETSGKINLKAQGYADLTNRTENYNKGTYLLDPADITVYGNVDPRFVSADSSIDLNTNLKVWLDGNDLDGDGVAEGAAENGLSGGNILTWVDKSEEGNDATGTTATQGDINGVTSVRFTNDIMTAADSFGGSIDEFHVFAITEENTRSSNFFLSFNGTNYGGLGRVTLHTPWSDGAWYWDGGDVYTSRVYIGGNPTSVGSVTQATFYKTVSGNQNGISLNGEEFSAITNGITTGTTTGGLRLGQDTVDHELGELVVYDDYLSSDEAALVEQYQSSKWGIELTPPGSGGDEAAKAMAADGYSAFTTDYLERLSATADIVLQADNTITLDLQGDTLALDDDRSISLATTNGNISTDSAGSIVTNRTGAGGNITFNAGGTGDINIDHALTLTAQNGGVVTFNAGGGDVNVTDNFNITTDNFNVATNNFNIIGNLNGNGTGSFNYAQGTVGNSLDVGSGGSGNVVLSDALVADIKAGFGSYRFGRADGGAITNYTTTWEDPVTFLTNSDFTNAVATTSDNTITITAGRDAIFNQDMSTTGATVDAIQISAGDNFINNAGNDALSATNSNWVVYSDDPVGNQNNGLLPDESVYNQVNIGATIASKASTGNNIFGYLTSTRPTITYDVGNESVEYGEVIAGAPTLTYNSGLVGDDTDGNIGETGAATINDGYTVGDNVGTYSDQITGSTGTLTNLLGYQYAFNAGDLTVTPATLAVTANDQSREYGDNHNANDISYSGFKLSDTIADIETLATISSSQGMASNAGTYLGALTASGANDAEGNYIFNYVDGDLTITPATLTVTANNVSREYGGANPGFTGSITGFKLSDNASVIDSGTANYTSLATNTSDAGSYAITSGGTFLDNNYDFNYVDGTLTINKANLSIGVDPASADKNEGDANPTFNLSFGPFKLADTQSDLDSLPTITSAATTNSPAGTFPVTLSGGSDNNYNYVFTDGALNIIAPPSSPNGIIPDAVQREIAIQPQRLEEWVDYSKQRLENSQNTIIIEIASDDNDTSKEQYKKDTTIAHNRKDGVIRLTIDKDLAEELGLELQHLLRSR